MPESRGPPFRADFARDPALVSDLYMDDAGVVSIAHPTVRAPGAQQTAAAMAALQDAGVTVHEGIGHDDATDEVVWVAAFYRHIVGSKRHRMREIVALSWSMAFCEAVVPAALESLVGYWSHSCLFRRAGFRCAAGGVRNGSQYVKRPRRSAGRST